MERTVAQKIATGYYNNYPTEPASTDPFDHQIFERDYAASMELNKMNFKRDVLLETGISSELFDIVFEQCDERNYSFNEILYDIERTVGRKRY